MEKQRFGAALLQDSPRNRVEHGRQTRIACFGPEILRRAGERQRDVTNAVFSYSAPYFGGTMALTNDPG